MSSPFPRNRVWLSKSVCRTLFLPISLMIKSFIIILYKKKKKFEVYPLLYVIHVRIDKSWLNIKHPYRRCLFFPSLYHFVHYCLDVYTREKINLNSCRVCLRSKYICVNGVCFMRFSSHWSCAYRYKACWTCNKRTKVFRLQRRRTEGERKHERKKKKSVKRAIENWTEVASRKVCCQQQTTMASDFIFVKAYFVMHPHSLFPFFYMLFKLSFTLISQYCRELIFSHFFFISNHKHK